MSESWWNSIERIDATCHRAQMTAIVAGCVALVGWLWPLPLVTVPAAVIATTAVLIALFTWFRKDDLQNPDTR